jgi:serine/threonine protein kinase
MDSLDILTETNATPAWHPGQSIGRYVLVAKLATGGMAEIWLARQSGAHGFEKVVVIKKLIDSDEVFTRMFMDEARIASNLDHPHIVHLYDLGEQGKELFIAMEYLAGSPLNHVLDTANKAGKEFPFRFSVRLVAWAAEGLAYAHTKVGFDGKPLNIVHRDISPQNLVVLYDGSLKIVDFGIAKASNRISRTEQNMFKGKISYASPEQVAGEDADARSDLFSLGLVLFEATTGKRLLRFDDPARVVAILSDTRTPMTRASQVIPGFPKALDDIIAKSLEKDRNARFQTAHAFQTALELWLRSQPPVGTAEISSFMHELFASRIQERAVIIDAALKDASGSGARRLLEASSLQSGSDSLLRATRQEGSINVSIPIRRMLWTVPLLLALLAGAWMFFGRSGANPAAQAPTTEATPMHARLLVNTDPPGAALIVDGEARGTSPADISPIKVGNHTIEARRDGFEVATRSVSVTEEGAHVEVTIPLLPVPEAKPPEPPKNPPAAQKNGYLSIDTQPWSIVYLGDRKLGETPLIRVSVPPGKLKLTLRNDEAGMKRVIEVEVQPGKTTATHLRF